MANNSNESLSKKISSLFPKFSSENIRLFSALIIALLYKFCHDVQEKLNSLKLFKRTEFIDGEIIYYNDNGEITRTDISSLQTENNYLTAVEHNDGVLKFKVKDKTDINFNVPEEWTNNYYVTSGTVNVSERKLILQREGLDPVEIILPNSIFDGADGNDYLESASIVNNILTLNVKNHTPITVDLSQYVTPEIKLESEDNKYTLKVGNESKGSFSIPVLPIIPGYYFTSEKIISRTFTPAEYEYVGTDLFKYPDNIEEHRYLYYVNNINDYKLVAQYLTPEPNSIYFVSTGYKAYDNSTKACPFGEIAYFLLNGDNTFSLTKTDYKLTVTGANPDFSETGGVLHLSNNYINTFKFDDPFVIGEVSSDRSNIKDLNGEFYNDTIRDEFYKIINSSNEVSVNVSEYLYNKITPFNEKYPYFWRLDITNYISGNLFDETLGLQSITDIKKVQTYESDFGSNGIIIYCDVPDSTSDNLYQYAKIGTLQTTNNSKEYSELEWKMISDLAYPYTGSNNEYYKKNVWEDKDKLEALWSVMLGRTFSSSKMSGVDIASPLYKDFKQDVGWTSDRKSWKCIWVSKGIEYWTENARVDFDGDSGLFNLKPNIDFRIQHGNIEIYGSINLTIEGYTLLLNDNTEDFEYIGYGHKPINSINSEFFNMNPKVTVTNLNAVYTLLQTVNNNTILHSEKLTLS